MLYIVKEVHIWVSRPCVREAVMCRMPLNYSTRNIPPLPRVIIALCKKVAHEGRLFCYLEQIERKSSGGDSNGLTLSAA